MKHMLWVLVLVSVSGMAAERLKETSLEELTALLTQYRDGHDGKLPASFRVHIHLDGYAKTGRPYDIYEFTPTEVFRLRPHVQSAAAEGVKEQVPEYDRDKQEEFKSIDEVCRILLALDYPDLVKGMVAEIPKAPRNLEYLSVMTGAGLPAMGDCSIKVSFGDKSFECHECCMFGNSFNSAQSIRFAALFHALRHLARSHLGLAQREWKDAIWKEPSDPLQEKAK